MKLTSSEQFFILNELLKSKKVSTTQMLYLLKRNESRPNQFLDDFAKEYKAIATLYERSKLAVRGNKAFSRLRNEMARLLPKLSPKERFKADAKSKGIEHLAPLFQSGKKLSNKEALVIYSHSKKHSGVAMDSFEIDRAFLMQDGHLVSLAKKYCKSIGLSV
jgi:hypothetical protein